LFGHTKILHTWVGMGSTALAAAVTFFRLGDPNFLQGIDRVLKQKSNKQILSER